MNRRFTKIHFIGIGAERAGTTWLAEKLDAHPEICLSRPKEIFYFNTYNNRTHPTKRNLHRTKSLQWYFSHWKHCQKNSIIGEFSTIYLYDRDAYKRIHSMFPDIKLIVVLRNPIYRLISQFLWYKYHFGLEKSDNFEEVVKHNPDYVQKSLYFTQLKRYFNLFSRENIYVVIFEEMIKNPAITLQDIYKFLNVNYNFLPDNLYLKSNQNTYLKSQFLLKIINYFASLTNDLGLYSLIEHTFESLHIKHLLKKCLYSDITEHKKITKQTILKKYDSYIQQLQHLFIADIHSLEKLINKDLSLWYENWF